MRTRLLGPLVALVVFLIVVFSYVSWSFWGRYVELSTNISLSSEVSRQTFELTRNRARTQELLLLFRLRKESQYAEELASLSEVRSGYLERIQNYAGSHPSLARLSDPLVGGLKEAIFLQDAMVGSIQSNDLTRADEAFRQLSIIFEINSARLQDFSLRLENELMANERDLGLLLSRTFWMLVAGVALCAVTIWLIAVFYGRNVLAPMQALHRGFQAMSRGTMSAALSLGSAPRELHDMTIEFNRMVEAIAAAQREIRAALNLRDEFLSIASHELKTPLTSLRLQAQLLQKRLASPSGAEILNPEAMRKFVEQIDGQVSRLNHLVEEMLDVSRIQAGRLLPNLERVDLAELVRTSFESFAPQFKEAHCEAALVCEGPVFGNWDRYRLEQVVINLLSNALKYGAGKPVRVEVSQIGGAAVLKVRDSGMGIAQEDQDRIFDRFERAVAGQGISGLGLGLYIVKQIVSAHQGVIRVESEKGRGSTFIVELPVNLSIARSPGDRVKAVVPS